jgi:hypothetical protein
MIFDPYPPPVCSFLLQSVGKFNQFLTPPPLKNADILNRWSLSKFPMEIVMSLIFQNNNKKISLISALVTKKLKAVQNMLNIP